MAVSSYEKDGKIYWSVYLDLRSRKDISIRVQKRVTNLTSEREAISRERQLLRALTEEITSLENRGATWRQIIDQWLRHQELYPSRNYAKNTVVDYAATLKKWTATWLDKNAADYES